MTEKYNHVITYMDFLWIGWVMAGEFGMMANVFRWKSNFIYKKNLNVYL